VLLCVRVLRLDLDVLVAGQGGAVGGRCRSIGRRNLYQLWLGRNGLRDESVQLGLVAGRVGALCGIWANCKSFLLAHRCRTARVENTRFGSKPPLYGKLRQSTSDSP
jgi:hypothetical protein